MDSTGEIWSSSRSLWRPRLLGVSVADFNPDGDRDGSHAGLTVAELAGLFSDYPKR